VAVSTVSEMGDTGPEEAIQFELLTTDGKTVALNETLAEGDTLLYFSMGVGSDGCLAQIPEIETTRRTRAEPAVHHGRPRPDGRRRGGKTRSQGS
jgi:peroxiredoxin